MLVNIYDRGFLILSISYSVSILLSIITPHNYLLLIRNLLNLTFRIKLEYIITPIDFILFNGRKDVFGWCDGEINWLFNYEISFFIILELFIYSLFSSSSRIFYSS